MKNRLGLTLIAGLLLAAPAMPTVAGVPIPNGEAPPIMPVAGEADFAGVVEKAVSGYIVPAYQALHGATRRLAASVDDVCNAPSSERREAVKARFAETITAWAGVDFFRFGPMGQEGRYERFAFWPDVHGTGARQLRQFLAAEDPKLLQPGEIARQSAAVQGVPALESLLFQGDAAVLSAPEPERFRCGLAMAVAHNLDDIAAAAEAGWTGEASWAELIEKPAPDNPVYRTHAEAMTEIVKAILTGLDQDRDHRLAPALGATPEDAKASRAPYARSGNALPYLVASADATERFVHASGLLTLVPPAQQWVVGSVGFEFANLKGALNAVGPDLDAALAQPKSHEKLVYAAIVLKSLRDLFQNQVSGAAGLSTGFNALDGD
jgi:predicted lipoprotein